MRKVGRESPPGAHGGIGLEEGEQGALEDLQRIPGVGPSIARDLYELGFRSVAELKGRDPETLYAAHCAQKSARVDRCWLYVARCAVYFASRERHDPAMLKWWAWKD